MVPPALPDCSQLPVAVFLCSRDSPLFDFIESCLRNKHEMVVYEAASAIVNLPGCSAKELAPAVSGVYVPPCLLHSVPARPSPEPELVFR